MEEDEATKRSSNAQFMVEGWWKSEENGREYGRNEVGMHRNELE